MVAPPAPIVTLVPDDDGFAVAGSPLRIDWGRQETGALAALERGFGPVLATDACGDLVVHGFGAVTVYFRHGALRGWRTDGASAGAVC